MNIIPKALFASYANCEAPVQSLKKQMRNHVKNIAIILEAGNYAPGKTEDASLPIKGLIHI